MKKIFLSAITLFLLLSYACNPKTSVKTSSNNTTEVSDAQLTAAKTKYPDANIESLKKGCDIYYGTCTKCHRAKKITKFTQEELPDIITHMAKKAKITEEERDAVLKYVMGVKLSTLK